jgi:hypothetical protein
VVLTYDAFFFGGVVLKIDLESLTGDGKTCSTNESKQTRLKTFLLSRRFEILGLQIRGKFQAIQAKYPGSRLKYPGSGVKYPGSGVNHSSRVQMKALSFR